MRRKVRILRHWKQRFHKDAEFIWRRSVTYSGKKYYPGDSIPDVLAGNKTKLRRFWESSTIELAQFEDPDVLTGQVTQAQAMVDELERQQAAARAKQAADDFAETENDDWLGESESVT